MTTIRQKLVRVFPLISRLSMLKARLLRRLRIRRLASMDRQVIFSEYFHNNRWGNRQSRSGAGSGLNGSRVVRETLPSILVELDIKTLIDVPCGDFFWMQNIDIPDIHYTGCDIVEPLIEANRKKFGNHNREFLVMDFCSTVPPAGDLLLCRDALVHLSNRDIEAAIENFVRSNSTYLLATTFPLIEENEDIVTGMWRPLNMTLPPFNFPEPLKMINEEIDQGHERHQGKCLGLWKLSDIAKRAQTS